MRMHVYSLRFIQQRTYNGMIPYLWSPVYLNMDQDYNIDRELKTWIRIVILIKLLFLVYTLPFENLCFVATSSPGLLKTPSRKNHPFHVAAKWIS
jgi:hypothetical protein